MKNQNEILAGLEARRVEDVKQLDDLRREGASTENLIFTLENYGRDLRARITALPAAGKPEAEIKPKKK